MNKLLKLTGVSMLTIVATTGANAAGYTCEELIEYTSCNSGYYLNAGKCIESTTCPSGSYLKLSCDGEDEAYFDVCEDTDMGSYMIFSSKDRCEEEGDIYVYHDGWNCYDGEGFYPASVSCTSCPSVGMTDKDGNAVTVKSEPGSFGLNSCYIDPNAYFENEKGVYHYTSNCSAVTLKYGMEIDEEICTTMLDGSWDGDGCNYSNPHLSQSECEKGEGFDVYWDSESGVCIGDWQRTYISSNVM